MGYQRGKEELEAIAAKKKSPEDKRVSRAFIIQTANETGNATRIPVSQVIGHSASGEAKNPEPTATN